MPIKYAPDIGIHGSIAAACEANDIRLEPSLTLCTPELFAAWAGPVSKRVMTELCQTTAFQRIASRASLDPTTSMRISVYSVRLEPGEFPSYRPDWHIDRVGGLRKDFGIEYVDLRDPLRFPSFLLTSIFVPDHEEHEAIHSRSTEFLLETFEGDSGELWADMREMHYDIDTWLAEHSSFQTYKAGNRTIVSFSPRTVHRPGRASVAGWSYLLRLGLYTALEPCSPYPDHFVFFNPVYHEPTGQVRFRRVGGVEASPEPNVRSVPLSIESGAAAAAAFAADQGLKRDPSDDSLLATIQLAADFGRRQLGTEQSNQR